MELRIIIMECATLISLNGTLNASCAEQFKQEMESVLEPRGKYVLDLDKLTRLDATGLSAIVSVLGSCQRKGGMMRLANIKGQVQTLFEVTRSVRLFEIYKTVAAAIADWKKAS